MDVLSILKGGIKPVDSITVSEWANKYRKLSNKSSAEPGDWRTERVPYLRAIMDSLSNENGINKVVYMKGAQVGGTEAGLNWIGYCIDVNPAIFLMIWPTIDVAKTNISLRIDPLIESTPTINAKIKPARSRDSGNTTFMKSFSGGSLKILGANSATSLRSIPAKYLFLDEVDAFQTDLNGEGSVIDLAKKRTSTYGDKGKLFLVSTPTRKNDSIIEKEFENTNKMYYHVPCPECKHLQVLDFKNLVWEKNKYDDVKYACIDCGYLIDERHKSWFLKEKGYGGLAEWLPTKDCADKSVLGFHLSGLYSPLGWLSWAQICREYDDAQGFEEKLKVFYNTTLGETFAEKTEAPAWENLYNRRESYKVDTIPSDVYFLTAGVDVQRDRLEYEVVGWCRGRRSYSIRYDVIMGDTLQKEVWDELADVLNIEFHNGMNISKMFVDSGYNTTTVYNFVNRFKHTGRVEAIKGKDSWDYNITMPKKVNIVKAGDRVGSCAVRILGVSALKGELYGWLKLERDAEGNFPDCYCHFPEYSQEYFRGLTAESLLIKKNKRGYETREWRKDYNRNEPLDCRVYARAAAIAMGMDKFQNNEKFWNKFRRLEKSK